MMNVFLALAAMAAQAPQGTAQPGATAQPGQVPQPRPTDFTATPVAVLLAGFDGDRDARVTRAEFDAGVAASFGEGEAMSPIAFSNWSVRWLGHQGALPGRFDFDADGDDRISRAEYAAELGRQFARLDANRDEVLDRSELVTVRPHAMQPMPGGRRRPRG